MSAGGSTLDELDVLLVALDDSFEKQLNELKAAISKLQGVSRAEGQP